MCGASSPAYSRERECLRLKLHEGGQANEPRKRDPNPLPNRRTIVKVLRVAGSVVAVMAVASYMFGAGSAARAQGGGAPVSRINWPAYGGDLASHRYAPLDQITKDNFNTLRLAWRLKTDFLGPRPDPLYSATPLFVDGMLYTTAGMRRAVVALDAI